MNSDTNFKLKCESVTKCAGQFSINRHFSHINENNLDGADNNTSYPADVDWDPDATAQYADGASEGVHKDKRRKINVEDTDATALTQRTDSASEESVHNNNRRKTVVVQDLDATAQRTDGASDKSVHKDKRRRIDVEGLDATEQHTDSDSLRKGNWPDGAMWHKHKRCKIGIDWDPGVTAAAAQHIHGASIDGGSWDVGVRTAEIRRSTRTEDAEVHAAAQHIHGASIDGGSWDVGVRTAEIRRSTRTEDAEVHAAAQHIHGASIDGGSWDVGVNTRKNDAATNVTDWQTNDDLNIGNYTNADDDTIEGYSASSNVRLPDALKSETYQ
eukprot:Opistho-2@26902